MWEQVFPVRQGLYLRLLEVRQQSCSSTAQSNGTDFSSTNASQEWQDTFEEEDNVMLHQISLRNCSAFDNTSDTPPMGPVLQGHDVDDGPVMRFERMDFDDEVFLERLNGPTEGDKVFPSYGLFHRHVGIREVRIRRGELIPYKVREVWPDFDRVDIAIFQVIPPPNDQPTLLIVADPAYMPFETAVPVVRCIDSGVSTTCAADFHRQRGNIFQHAHQAGLTQDCLEDRCLCWVGAELSTETLQPAFLEGTLIRFVVSTLHEDWVSFMHVPDAQLSAMSSYPTTLETRSAEISSLSGGPPLIPGYMRHDLTSREAFDKVRSYLVEYWQTRPWHATEDSLLVHSLINFDDSTRSVLEHCSVETLLSIDYFQQWCRYICREAHMWCAGIVAALAQPYNNVPTILIVEDLQGTVAPAIVQAVSWDAPVFLTYLQTQTVRMMEIWNWARERLLIDHDIEIELNGRLVRYDEEVQPLAGNFIRITILPEGWREHVGAPTVGSGSLSLGGFDADELHFTGLWQAQMRLDELSGEIGDIYYPQPDIPALTGVGEIGDIYYPQPMPESEEVSQMQTSTSNKIHREVRSSQPRFAALYRKSQIERRSADPVRQFFKGNCFSARFSRFLVWDFPETRDIVLGPVTLNFEFEQRWSHEFDKHVRLEMDVDTYVIAHVTEQPDDYWVLPGYHVLAIRQADLIDDYCHLLVQVLTPHVTMYHAVRLINPATVLQIVDLLALVPLAGAGATWVLSHKRHGSVEIFQDDDIIQVPSGTYVSLKGQVAQQMQCQTTTSMDSSYNDHTLPPELPFGTTRVDISQDIAQFEENVASLGLWQNLVRFLPGVINVLGARNLRDPPSRRTEEIAQGGRDPIMDALQIVWNDEDLNNADRIHFFRPKFRRQSFDVETSYSWQERNAISISDVLADVWPDLDRIAFQIERIIHEESVYCADDDAVFMILEPRAPWWPHGWHAALVEKTQVLGDFIQTMMVPIMLPKRTSQLELCVLMFGPERGAFCEVRRYGAALQPDQVCWNYVGTLVHLIQRHEETALIRPPHNPNWNFGTIFAVGLPFFTETPDLRIVAILKREFRDMQTMEIFRPPTRFVSQSMVVTLQAWYTWGVIDGKLKARWPELQDSSWVRPAVDETWKESHQLRHRQHVHVLIEPAFVTNNVVVLLAMTDEEEEWVKAVFMIGRLTVHDLLRDYGKLSKCQQEGQSCIVRHNGDWKNMDDPMVLRHRDMIQIFIAATAEAEVCLPARKMPRKLQVAMASDSSSAGTTRLQIKAVKSDTSFARHAWNRLPRPGNGSRKVHFDDVIQQRCFNSRTIVEQRFVQDNAVSNDYVLQLVHEKKQGASWQSFVNDVRFEHLKDNPPFLWTPEGCKDEQQAKAMLPQLSDDYVVRPAPTSIGKNHWCLMDKTSQVLPIFLCGQEVQLCYVAKYSKLQEMELVFHCRLKGENDRQTVLFPGQVFFVIEESQCTPSPKPKRLWKEYSDTKQKENDQGYDSPDEANSHSKPIDQGRSRVTEEVCCQLFPPVADRTIESEEVLLLDLNVNDEQEKKLVPVINQVRRDRPFVEDLPEELAAAVMSVPDWLGNEQGTIHVFTDGSYLRDTDVAGWAAIILMEGTSDVPFSYVGYIAGRQEAHSQEAGEAGAYVAELLGIGNAAEIINASSSRCHFHVDSTSAADVAFGRAAIGSFASLASAVRHRVMVLESRMEVSVSHVKGHSGHPWNEAVDRLAGAVRTGMLEPTNHILFDPTKQNEWAWALHESGESNDMPVQQNGMFLVEAPPLQPVLDFCLPTLSRATEETIELKARFVTYNACSVHVPGRRQFLSKQFDQEQICAVGIQESQDRSQNDFGFDHWQVFRSAADKHGNFGCELWLHIKKTIVQGKGQKHGWDVQSAIVKVREPRLLIVTIAAGKVPFALIVLHAPSNHLGEEVQETWWAQTTKSVKRAVPHSHHVIVLADANAQLLRPGDLGSCRGHYNVSSPAEELFFDWLQTENLVVRTREDDEGRSLFTWSHSSATDVDEVQKGSCLDYIATSSDLASCGTSIDLSGFDTGREKIDHLPVGIEFKTWIGTSFQNMPKRKPRVDVDIINTPAGEAICKQIALSIPQIPWEIDATSHAQIFEEHVSDAMLQYFPKPKRQPKKPFLDQEAIQLVRQRRLTQRWLKQLKAFRRLCQTWFFFQAWKYHKCEDRSLPDFRSWNSEGGRCQGQLELFARDLMRKYQNVAKHKLRAYVSDSVTVASQEGLDHLFQRLRKLTKSRKHKTKFSLPALQKPDGAVANTPLQVYEIWEKHFQESERGQFVDSMALQHEHQEKAFKRFVETAQSNEVLTSADVPTLQECEQALLKFARKRAPGLSGIPIDLLRNAAPDFARKAYPLVLKSVLRFEEPLQWQGSLIAPIPKSNGISPHAKDWRQISLQEGLAKMTHRAYREKLMPYFESFASPLQGGARRGMPTSLPAQAVLLFQGACHQRKISSMVIFLDAKQAYYQIARDVLWFRQWPPDRQRDFLDRMPCSEHMKQQIGEVFSARCPLEQCSVPSKIGNIIQSLFEDVWTTRVNGMPSCSMTGTRPGDPLADLLWSIAFGSVIRQLKSDFTELDLVYSLTVEDSHAFQYGLMTSVC